MPKKQRPLSKIYKSMKPHVEAVAKSNLVNPDFYSIVLRAALAKSFDFNSYVSNLGRSSHSFYHTATLRGICEDLIVLRAIHGIPPADRSELITHLQRADIHESVKNQTKFFDTNRPQQPVVSSDDSEILWQGAQAKALAIYDKYGYVKKGRRPTIRQL